LGITADELNRLGAGYLPGHLGIVIKEVAAGRVSAELAITPFLMAPNGYLHAGSLITLADTASGYGCITNLPDGATGFTTIELKSNHLGTAREGTLTCVATAVHMGKTTQVWDAEVRKDGVEKPLALFRCTQLILYGRSPA
jgi:1,4-dihydroxy-2-naphthoyl-CoA hydrolase